MVGDSSESPLAGVCGRHTGDGRSHDTEMGGGARLWKTGFPKENAHKKSTNEKRKFENP